MYGVFVFYCVRADFVGKAIQIRIAQKISIGARFCYEIIKNQMVFQFEEEGHRAFPLLLNFFSPLRLDKTLQSCNCRWGIF